MGGGVWKGRESSKETEREDGWEKARERERSHFCAILWSSAFGHVGGQQRLWSRKELGGIAESERGRAIIVARETVQHESDSTRGGLCAAV